MKWMDFIKPKPKVNGIPLVGKVVAGNIPTGGLYKQGEIQYNEGQALPVLKEGDIFIYGDYEYRYANHFDRSIDDWSHSSYNGWGVRVLDEKKVRYGEILEEINGSPIVSLRYTFADCKEFCEAPIIPDTVKCTFGTFGCCDKLEIAPVLPRDIEDCRNMFCHCYILKTYHNSDNYRGDFSDYIIPEKITDIFAMFYNCGGIKIAPKFHNKLEGMRNTFTNCWSLHTVSDIPASVTTMEGTFKNCIALTGKINIDAKPKEYAECFNGTIKYIRLFGDGNLKKLAITSNNRNINI